MEVETIRQLAIAATGAPIEVTNQGRTYLITPPQWGIHDKSLPNAADLIKPKTVSQRVEVQTVASLIAYVERFKTGQTMIFADLEEERIEAIVDYHNTTPGKDQAELCAHRAVLELRTSYEWDIWTGSNDAWFTQPKFARFLTENSMDVMLGSDGANLYELVLDLEGEANIRVAKRMRSAHSGQGQSGANVEKRINTPAGASLPSEFEVVIPVFMGEPPVHVRTFFKDDLTDGGGIKLGYQMSRTAQIQQAEIERICGNVAAATGIGMIVGKVA